MKKPNILRKRYIPDEVVNITGDELLFRDEKLFITKWKAIKPRNDIFGGVSYTFLEDGFKISRFYNEKGQFLYWYCDIIDVDYNVVSDTYTIADLLVDIKVMPDGAPMVLDTDELAEALERRLITLEQACRSLRSLDRLLKMIYEGKFPPEVCREKEYWGI